MSTALAVLAAGYVWSWLRTEASGAERISIGRLWAFLAGLVTIWLAVGPILGHLDQGYLTAHMVQHLLLMTLAAPLLLLGEPARVFRQGIGPFREPSSLQIPSPNPLLCWFAGTGTVLF